MKKALFIIIILFSVQSVKSQEFGVAVDAGYSFKFLNKSVHQLYLGGIAAFSKGNRGYSSYDNQFLLGGGVYYGKYNDKTEWIPAVVLGYGGGIGPLYKIAVTPYNVTPSFNLNFFNIAQLGIGYSFGYKRKNDFNMNGICLSFNIALGTSGYYVNMSN